MNARMRLQLFVAWAWLTAIASACANDHVPPTAATHTGLALLQTHSARGAIAIKSWKALRDEKVVKQNLDYSCGAASLSTLITHFYGHPVSEETLLKAMDKGDGKASFHDMAQVMRRFGFKAQGFAATWNQLVKLRIPVVVYLKHRRDDHFAVIRGIDEHTVWLADPNLGNRTYSRQQFLAMWQTRERQAQAELAGKFLAVIPAEASITQAKDFFTKTPRRQNVNAVHQLAFRLLP